jgi:hypothetical protein
VLFCSDRNYNCPSTNTGAPGPSTSGIGRGEGEINKPGLLSSTQGVTKRHLLGTKRNLSVIIKDLAFSSKGTTQGTKRLTKSQRAQNRKIYRGYKTEGNALWELILHLRTSLWSSGQISWLQMQRSRVRFPALPD